MSKFSETPIQLGDVRPPTHTVAWREGALVRRDELLIQIDAWRSLLENKAGHNFALYINDSIEFAGALLGALQAGKKVYLPSDVLPATCLSLSQAVDGYLGEFPAQWSPLFLKESNSGFQDCHCALSIPHMSEVVVFTSGSTGEAQAISKHMSQLLTEVAALESLFGHLCDGADVMSTVSHQHIYGLLFKVLWPLAAGRPIHSRSFSFPEELVAAAAARETVLISSPAHLKRFPESPAWAGASSRIRAIFSSGGPLEGKVAMEIERLAGKAPIEIYGSSETGGIAWRQCSPRSDDGWIPMPGVEWRADALDGVLEVRSAHLPDSNWLRMADRVLAAGDNRFQLQGRTDRIVKIEEKRVSLDAIEKQLISSPMVSEARVLLVEMGQGGRQRIAGFVVPSAHGRSKLAEVGKLAFNRQLRGMLLPSFERVALPKIWRYLDRLPVNAQGKTTYTELRTMLDTAIPANTLLPMPKLPIARLLERDAQRVLIELVMPDNLLYFEGHFPGSPILPGVVQVDWAVLYGRQYLELPSCFQEIQMLKFQRFITPGMALSLELKHDSLKSCLVFRYFTQAGQHASGRIVFGAHRV